MLSMVSKTVSQHIINYISTSSGSKRLLLQDFHSLELPGKRQDSAVLEHYRSLGNLCNKNCNKQRTVLNGILLYISVRLMGNEIFPNMCRFLWCFCLQCEDFPLTAASYTIFKDKRMPFNVKCQPLWFHVDTMSPMLFF